MTQKTRTVNSGRQVFIANESFVANVGGVDRSFHEGRTRAYEGDEILTRVPHLFDRIEDHDAHQNQ